MVDVAHDRSENQKRKPKGGASSEEHLSTFNTRETKPGVGQSLSSNKFTPTVRCPSCNGNHSLAKCSSFKDKNFDERPQVMRKAQLCFNCFKYGHISVGCLVKSACEIQGCRRRHNTLLHPPSPQKKRLKFKTVSLIKEFRLTAELHYKVHRLTVPQLEEERCA